MWWCKAWTCLPVSYTCSCVLLLEDVLNALG